MAYCTQADIEKLLPADELAQITADSGDLPDADIVTEAIVKADAEIDAYCGKQYAVPFIPVPGRIEALSVDMAIYHLFSRRSLAPEIRRQKYEDAVAFLKDVSRGLAVIGSTDSPPTSTGGSSEVKFDSQDRVFSRSTLRDL